jgi:hypothetical protein
VQFPVRLSIVTYNLWNTQQWPERAPALELFLARYRPDVLCVQELTPETRDFLDEHLGDHARVDDPLPGWATASNIWWRRDLFERIDHGAEEFDCVAYPDRRLFWVRLRPLDRQQSFVVSTVHLTDFGTEHELTTGESPRVTEANRVVEGLARVVGADEPAFVVGDFNDAIGPLVPLLMAGYTSSFGALEQIPPTTMPASLSRFGGAGFSSAFVLDWICANRHARAISTSSPHVYAGDTPPSDHWPVHAVYELTPPGDG